MCSAVTSDSSGSQFESSHRQKFILNIFTVNYFEKTKNEEKEAGNGPFLIKISLGSNSKIHSNRATVK